MQRIEIRKQIFHLTCVHRVHKWIGDEDLKENLKDRYKVELKLNLEGKLDFKPAEDLLDEL